MFPSPKKLDRVFSEVSFLLWENSQINIMETIMNDKEHATMLLYGKDGNGPKIEVLIDKDSVWLTQKQMADLFGVDRTVIGKHLKTVFSSGELNQDVVCANFAHIASDGPLSVKITFATLSVLHGVVKHAIFAGVYR